MSDSRDPVRLVGAGPTGALLAILLQRRGREVELYESRPDPRQGPDESGRSINLALASRGVHALRAAGLYETLQDALLPMRGRLIHDARGHTTFQPYGLRPDELLHSISRERLNRALVEIAASRPGVAIRFEHRFEAAEFDEGTALFRDLRRDRLIGVPMQPLLATDGAASVMRRRMSSLGLIEAREDDLEHGYKELTIPSGAAGRHLMKPDALHIWPRGEFMLIALPNTDGSFTATLFMRKRGADSLETLTRASAIDEFLSREFPDAHALMPDCVEEFQAHPTGFLGTVRAAPWSHRDMTALIGDSAHAIVPFHGQGLNCCFEDCLEFDACLERQGSWSRVFDDYFERRKVNTDAIADMALDNYLEMRAHVADPRFQLQQSLALELERRFPQRFIPRYSMVMFHHEIPYGLAAERGAAQASLLAELTSGAVESLADVDFARAEREIAVRLPPIA